MLITWVKKGMASILLSTVLLGMQVVSAQAINCSDNIVDDDNDGLIELCFLEDLDAVRYVLDGTGYKSTSGAVINRQGCPLPLNANNESRCRGYELVRDLDFKLDTSYRNSTANKTRWTTMSTGGWLPIGDNDNRFSGTFDGNGYTLSNLTIHTAADYVGLFGVLSSSGTITGTSLSDVVVHGNARVGSLVGHNYGVITHSYSSGAVNGTQWIGGLVGINNRLLSNSYSIASVSGTGRSEGVGGLVGASRGTISNSYSDGAVSGYNRVGGLVGWNIGIITDSYSRKPARGNVEIGGLVGTNGLNRPNRATISNSYSRGSVHGRGALGGLVGTNWGTIINSNSSGSVTGPRDRIGGLVGAHIGYIVNSYSSGVVTGGTLVGGLVGQNISTGRGITNSFSSGSVKSTVNVGNILSFYGVGGLVGLNDGKITNSYSRAAVKGYQEVGGLVGRNGETGSIINSYSRGLVQGMGSSSRNVGGLVGWNGGQHGFKEGHIKDSYWDITTSRVKTGAGGGKTTLELQAPTSTTGIYSAWSSVVWDFGATVQYPVLKYTTGTDVNNLACGIPQHPPCGRFLDGQRIRQIAISKAMVRADVAEGETVILDATSDSNVNYQWETGDVSLLSTNRTAELKFLVPNDLVNKEATTKTLTFQLTVSTGTTTIRQQTVQIVVYKIDNGPITHLTVTRIAPRRITLSADLTTDPDGAGMIEMYQWQKCLANTECGQEDQWRDISGATNDSYQIPDNEENNQFRIQLTYRDGQNYQETLVSEPLIYELRIIDIDPITAKEGEIVTIVAKANVNFDGLSYAWRATTGDKTPSILAHSTLNIATLMFTVPEDWTNTTQATLSLLISVGDGTFTSTQSVIVNIARADNGGLTTMPTIIETGGRLVVSAGLTTDPDGGGMIEAYQWQVCPADVDCTQESQWQRVVAIATGDFYQIPEIEAVENTQFRVQLIYRDGQGYRRTVISEALNYQKAIFLRLKLFLEGALQ